MFLHPSVKETLGGGLLTSYIPEPYMWLNFSYLQFILYKTA